MVGSATTASAGRSGISGAAARSPGCPPKPPSPRITAVDQKAHLFDSTIEENLRLANRGATDEQLRAALQGAASTFDALTGVLGLLYNRNTDDIPAEVHKLAEARTAARKAKDWARADALRDELAALGYVVEDTANGPKIVKK